MQIKRIIPEGHPLTEPLIITLTEAELEAAHEERQRNFISAEAKSQLDIYFGWNTREKSEKDLLRFRNIIGVPYEVATKPGENGYILDRLVDSFMCYVDDGIRGEDMDDIWDEIITSYIKDINYNFDGTTTFIVRDIFTGEEILRSKDFWQCDKTVFNSDISSLEIVREKESDVVA